MINIMFMFFLRTYLIVIFCSYQGTFVVPGEPGFKLFFKIVLSFLNFKLRIYNEKEINDGVKIQSMSLNHAEETSTSRSSCD